MGRCWPCKTARVGDIVSWHPVPWSLYTKHITGILPVYTHSYPELNFRNSRHVLYLGEHHPTIHDGVGLREELDVLHRKEPRRALLFAPDSVD